MKLCARLIAPLLTLALLLTPAMALTPQQAGELLVVYYVDSVPGRVLEQASVEDMLTQLGDPYTVYFTAEEYAAFMNTMRDEQIYGIGVTMQLHAQGVQITEVLPGLGAERAGLKAGDLVTAVEGKTIAGMGIDAIKALISGEEGSTVKLAALRGEASREYTVTRMKIVIPATTTTLIDERIGYIDCRTFGEETLGHFKEGIAANDYQADRWIVDLRSNLGGDTMASVETAATFAGGGNLAYLREKDGRYGVYKPEGGALTLDPAIVLVNEDTASASEIFAAAIRDRQAGIVIGSRTYGKGVAQVLLDESVEPEYFSDGSALKVTAARVFSEGGATTDKVGIIPHLLVPDQYAPDIAYLMAGQSPKGDTSGKLRVDIKWRWYVELEAATEADYLPAFAALLEAVSPSTPLWLGTGGVDGWRRVTAEQVAEECGVTDYAPRGFDDVAESPYANEISTLATYGVVAGSGDGTFRPEATITRAQFCALLAQALRYTSTNTGTFADVPTAAWYADEVEALSNAGLVNGYSDGLFHPDDPMDHQQFMAVLARAARGISMDFYEAQPEDYNEMMSHPALAIYPKWVREDVWLLDGSQVNPIGIGVSLLWESLTDIDPLAPTTRGEAACALYNVLAFSGILPV